MTERDDWIQLDQHRHRQLPCDEQSWIGFERGESLLNSSIDGNSLLSNLPNYLPTYLPTKMIGLNLISITNFLALSHPLNKEKQFSADGQ